jgi:hypothetical protein
VSKVIWHVTMPPDGFITGPDDAMGLALRVRRIESIADEIMEATGAILPGRRWYGAANERIRRS